MDVAKLALVCQDLTTCIVNVEVHLVAKAKFFHQLPQLLERVEKSDSTATIEVVWFDEPYVFAIVHFVGHGELSGDQVLVLELCLHVLVLKNELIDLGELVVELLLSWI